MRYSIWSHRVGAVLAGIGLCVSVAGAFEGRPWVDSAGHTTGLINYNPDPNGEPWLAGGLPPVTNEEMAKRSVIPEHKMNARTRGRELPAEVILLKNPEFVPVFNQIGGSCAQASGVAYTYSYQLNVLRHVAGSESNMRAYGFTHNFLNGGDNSYGSWYWDGWDILKTQGAPSVQTMHNAPNGGLNGTMWMNGASRWHESNDNRVLKYEKITINSLADIEKIKSWMYDLDGTDPYKKGGCVVFSSNANSATPNSVVSSGPHQGESLSTGLNGAARDHAMTFAGYSDSVAGGALLLLNSWGSDWGTNGYTWVPYSVIVGGGLSENQVWCVTVGEYTPKYELKAHITSSNRGSLLIRTGLANSDATKPTMVKEYGKAFNYSGGAYPMEGMFGQSTIEVSLDASEFFDSLSGNSATFFMQAIGTTSKATITDLELIDYTGITPKTISASASNLFGDTLNVPVPYSMVSRFHINASVQGNGTISGMGDKLFNKGENYTCSITPDRWYVIDSVVVDGANVGSGSTYSFNNIDANHTITAYFSRDSQTPTVYTITTSPARYGTVSPLGSIETAHGFDTTISLTPDEWHSVDSVLVDGVNRGPLVSADFKYLTNSHTIVPYFSTKGFESKYPLWDASTIYSSSGRKDTVSYNGHLWESSWWNKGCVPGGAEWRDLGVEVIVQTKPIVKAFMEYRSNEHLQDTIIIRTLSIMNGDTTTSYDTITDAVVPVDHRVSAPMASAAILQNGRYFLSSSKGSFALSVFDLRGRVVYRSSFVSDGHSMVELPVSRALYSSGVYLMRIVGCGKTCVQKISL